MPRRESHKLGSELFIVDNSAEEWKALRYLHDWCGISKAMDIATGYFEIGSLLALDGEWQKVGQFRILMGDEVSQRTQRAFAKGLTDIKQQLDRSLATEKLANPFLEGVPAIVDAIRSGQILCRVYRKDKFHAKAYITHAKLDVIGSSALVGSSNFTKPGLTQNVELNVQITGTPVAVLQEWFEEHWEQSEDVTPELLQTVERHSRAYSPFEVYARSLQQFFTGYEESASEWDRNSSVIYPILAQYQRDAYHGLLKRASDHGGAFLCDGVGLGKTFVGLMLIERLVKHENKNVALFAPKSALGPVWERELKKRLPDLFKGYSRLKVFSHTDLNRDKLQEELDQVRAQADVIIIDEAHHFRNTGTKGESEEERKSRYWKMFDLAKDKTVYMLTATPINNSLLDFQHMVELFSRKEPAYFASKLGVNSFPGYIRRLEKQIEHRISGSVEGAPVDMNDASELISEDDLFKALVVQRSRSYVRASLEREGTDVVFPQPRQPQVKEYSVKQTYGRLLDMIAEAFAKRDPLFNLSIYDPYRHYIGKDQPEKMDFSRGRSKAVVSLIRTSFLKRFESSVEAFRNSCWRLLWKLLAWAEVHAETEDERSRIEHWKRRHKALLGYTPQGELFDPDADDEDLYPQELSEAVEQLSREEFDVSKIIEETLQDLDQVADFLKELERFTPAQDAKVKALIKLLQSDPVASQHKVLIFSEFADTARYIAEQLQEAGIAGVAQIDSGSKGDRTQTIKRFAPYYNESSSAKLAEAGEEEIRVLVATDVLSEGLNLQDATRLINYDLHWNPVRLMQRIGRVDRRMDPAIEKAILADHPDQKAVRGTVGYWNFLPPEELDELLRLYKRVAHKTLRISRTLGIEGKKLLKEDDDYEDLKNFSEQYEGRQTPEEEMHLLWQDLVRDNPGLDEQVVDFPDGIFSGKPHISQKAKGVFFCFARPGPQAEPSGDNGEHGWTAEAGDVRWYLLDLATGEIVESAPAILEHIRCEPDTARTARIPQVELKDAKAAVEKHIAKTYLRKVQAPVGVRPILRAWMELN